MSVPTLPFDSTLLVPGSRLCVALSGGSDSVALLCALHHANLLPRAPLGVGLSAVHIHHGLREQEADLDADFVQALCSRLDVPLQVHRVSVPARRQTTGETVEEAARNARYEVFHSILSNSDLDDLLTAHTLDDQAETVLMKLLRGAWTEGLGGIHPILRPVRNPSKRILRPLLQTKRSQILAYLDQIDQPWREDSSNADPAHTRNRVRHHILPLLRKENPSLDQTLANLAELAREEEDRWQTDMARLLPQILLPGKPVRGGGRAVSTTTGHAGVSIEIDRLRSLDNATRRRVLRAAARSLRVPDGSHSDGVRLSFTETSRLLALCGFRDDPTVPSRPGTFLHLSQNLSAKISVRELSFCLAVALPTKSVRQTIVPGTEA